MAPYITHLFNLSLAVEHFPLHWKHTIVMPLLKKTGLDVHNVASYRPVSNLPHLSKMLERIINCQLVSHLEEFRLLSEVQSVYRRGHSTETAVLKVFSNLVDAISNEKFALRSLLDLSAAFDTVDHNIRLHRFEMSFVFRGAPLECLCSYLEGRSRSVVLNSHSTVPRPVTCGVPQGSVLGPLLFTLYTANIGKVIQQHRLSHHCYADDNQVYAACTLSECMAFEIQNDALYRVDRRMDGKQQTRAQPTRVGVFVVRFASSHQPDRQIGVCSPRWFGERIIICSQSRGVL